MKCILILFMACMAYAQNNDVLSVPGLAQTVATYAKQAKAIGLVDAKGVLGTGGFLPLRTFHDSSNVNYVEAGFGASIKQQQHLKPLFILDLDVSSLWRRFENFQWYNVHVSKVLLPDFWIGPYIDPASFTTWNNWKQCLGATVTVGL